MCNLGNPLSQAQKHEKNREVDAQLESSRLHPLVIKQSAKDIWTLLLMFRVLNAFLVRTFFQPDEYFQSLEPAWQMAFGTESGAWITWAGSPDPYGIDISLTYPGVAS
ncbi:hypothetical protein K3495_g11498 [Podosphaera aphanis]|nr:hypothetical protein K3495_g11498 [Podosphaera aphanis]